MTFREKSLLDAAEQILARKGCVEFTTQELAEVAGVGKGTVYAHHPSRTEWVQSVLSLVAQRSEPLLEKAALGADPPERLSLAISALVDVVTDPQPDRLSVPCCLRMAPCAHAHWPALTERLRAWLDEAIQAGLAPALPPDLAIQLSQHLLVVVRRLEPDTRTESLQSIKNIYLANILGICPMQQEPQCR